LANARVEAKLSDASGDCLLRIAGESEATGRCRLLLPIPAVACGKCQLTVTSRYRWFYGASRLREEVEVAPQTELHISSDKPFYQPGQDIHLRALTLSAYDQKPLAGRHLLFEISDAQDTRVFRQGVDTSPYGIAATSFRLAQEIRHGTYTIAVHEAGNKAQLAIEVRKYELPKLKVTLRLEPSYILPEQQVLGEVSAGYAFGQPVSDAPVQLTLSLVSGSGYQQLLAVETRLDRQGRAPLALNLPKLELQDDEIATLLLSARVTAADNSVAETSTSLPLAKSEICFDIVPEAGYLVPGLENIIYCIVARPDGTPLAGATITIADKKLVTDKFGLAAYSCVASDTMTIKAIATNGLVTLAKECTLNSYDRAAAASLGGLRVFVHCDGDTLQVMTVGKGAKPVYTKVRIPELNVASPQFAAIHRFTKVNMARNTIALQIEDVYGQQTEVSKSLDYAANYDELSDILKEYEQDSTTALPPQANRPTFLLRCERSIYRDDEPLAIEVISNVPDAHCVLELRKNGQPVAHHDLTLTQGQATLELPQAPASGFLQLLIYHREPGGTIRAASKVIYVASKSQLQVAVHSDKPSYRPGEEATVSFALTSPDNKPRPGVLGVTIVDESVFWLGSQTPEKDSRLFSLPTELMSPHLAPRLLPGRLTLSDAVLQCLAGRNNQELATAGNILLAKAAPRPRIDIAASGSLPIAKTGVQKIATWLRDLLLPGGALLLLCVLSLAAFMAGRGRFILPPALHEPWLRVTETVLGIAVINAFLGMPFLLLCHNQELSLLPVLLMPVILIMLVEHMREIGRDYVAYRQMMGLTLLNLLNPLLFLLLSLVWPFATTDVSASTLLLSAVFLFLLPLPALILRNRLIGKRSLYTNQEECMNGYLSVTILGLFGSVVGLAILVFLTAIATWNKSSEMYDMLWLGGLVLLFASCYILVRLLYWLGKKCYTKLGLNILLAPGCFVATTIFFILIGGIVLPVFNKCQYSSLRSSFHSGFNQLEQIVKIEEDRQQLPDFAKEAGQSTTRQPPRSFFPETLYVNPSLITDEQGRASITLPMADSLTTWRISTLGHTMAGEVAAARANVSVFQPFFLDLKVPLQLTVGDEIEVPLTLYNYLEREQVVSVNLTPSPGIVLLGPVSFTLAVRPQDVAKADVKIRATGFGNQSLTVAGVSGELRDAVRKSFAVEPFGRKCTQVQNVELGDKLELSVPVPPDAIPEATSVHVYLDDSPTATLLGGLDGLLNRPYG
jgi:hypothetical protein